MIPIVKGNTPRILSEEIRSLKATPGAVVGWDEVRNKAGVLEELCREQGYLCAYCMKKISAESAHVEHIAPQSDCAPGQDIAYSNMLAVCDGNEGGGNRDNLTCDRSRGNAPLRVNPLRPETLEGIRYKKDGVIYSRDSEIQRDLNETLNLNCRKAYLPQNRKCVIDLLSRKLRQQAARGNLIPYCIKQLEKIEGSSSKPEFAGVLTTLLRERIRRG